MVKKVKFSPLSSQRCFTFMDRGFMFKQINNYINCFMPGDPKVFLSLQQKSERNTSLGSCTKNGVMFFFSDFV